MTEARIIKRPDDKWDVVLIDVQRNEYNSIAGSPALGLSSAEAVQAFIGFEYAGAVRPDANLFVFDGKGGEMYHGAVYQFLQGDVKLEEMTEAQT